LDFLITHSPALIVALPLVAAFAIPLISIKWAGDRVRNTFVLAIFGLITFLVAILAVDVHSVGIRVYTFGATAADLALPGGYTVPVRIMFEVDGMSMFMGFTGDMFNLFVFLEIASIAGAGLAAYRTNMADAVEGGFKYIVISAVSALLVLFAIGILYAQYNVLSIAALAHYMQYTTLDMMALGLLGGAFVIKLAGVPLHMWAPDTYTVAPAGTTPMILAASYTSMYALYRVTFSLYGGHIDTTAIGWIVIIVGVLSMFIGVMMAVHQTDIKRMMAYHAISQGGYMLLGVGVGLAVIADPAALANYGRDAINGGIFHIINHVFYKALLFMTAEAIFFRIGTRDTNKMGGLARNMKWTTAFYIIGALAISGIPPLNGFASKLLIYESVLKFNPVLAVIAMFVSLVTLASFTKVFYSAFTGPEMPAYKEVKEVPKSMIIGMAILAACVIFFGLFPGLIVKTIVAPATNALINQASYIGAVMGAVP
jgi:multicomponent Na+:H+ antiporter subunit D